MIFELVNVDPTTKRATCVALHADEAIGEIFLTELIECVENDKTFRLSLEKGGQGEGEIIEMDYQSDNDDFELSPRPDYE